MYEPECCYFVLFGNSSPFPQPASKLAISVFLKHGEINEREKELIKAIPEEEVISAIVSNAKLSTPGLTSFLNSKKGGSARKVIDIEIADV
jgi:hypothetical protein